MIYTCTLNPSIDYVMHLEQFTEGKVNRTNNVEFYPGGKGINVSLVLQHMNIKSTLLGFVGGYIGEHFKGMLKEFKHMNIDFTKIKDNTRINVVIESGNETNINAAGPQITEKEYESLLGKIWEINENDCFILSGSVPHLLEKNVYEEIAHIVYEQGAMLIIDTTGKDLLDCLKYKPFFIKPNQYELGDLFNVKIESNEDIIKYARLLMEQGAQNVLVSMGKDGAILVSTEGVYYADSPKIKVESAVGAGDSMVAGFTAEYLNSRSFAKALRLGSACGSATASSPTLGTLEEINSFINKIEVTKLA